MGGLLGVWRGSEVLEVDWRGLQGFIEGLVGVFWGSEVLEGFKRTHRGLLEVFWGSSGGLRSWKDQSRSEGTHRGL